MESINSRSSNKPADFYSVKFYPYTKAGDDPVYALVGGKHVRIFPMDSPRNYPDYNGDSNLSPVSGGRRQA